VTAKIPKITLAIPARLASTRLPRKMLLDLGGKTLIQRVWDECNRIRESVSEIVVLTESPEIREHVEGFGGNAILTPDSIRNGTERVAFYASQSDSDYFINCQGDDPNISHSTLLNFVEHLILNQPELLTVIRQSVNSAEINSPNTVKVVLDQEMKTQYFSRYAIPFDRDGALPSSVMTFKNRWIHTGIYGYSRKALLDFLSWNESSDESLEKLEQLRFLSKGMKFSTIVDDYVSTSIDVYEDVEKAMAKIVSRNQSA
jgi:3-deoxy-manno-octulosonate cytidylyltransferase (CMP-KDO synthetase)